jgi:hypothetical protein
MRLQGRGTALDKSEAAFVTLNGIVEELQKLENTVVVRK